MPNIKTFFVILDSRNGTNVGKLIVNDPDKDVNCTFQYNVPRVEAEKYSIDSYGDLLTKAALDRETQAQYMFYITVKDCGLPPLTDSIRVLITVSDVNDNSPKFSGPYKVNVPESEASGTPILQVQASGIKYLFVTFISHRLSNLCMKRIYPNV